MMAKFSLHQSVFQFLMVWSVAVSAAPSRATGNHVTRQEEWPFGPFTTSGRDIKNANNETIVFAGINWSGHGEAMIPEGLQYASVEDIVTGIRGLGINSIRLTYAIEMVDDIYSNQGQDTTIQQSILEALGDANGTAVFEQVVARNPNFDETTTRLQVFDAVAAECARQNVYINLDNHMSRAAWCCSTEDGNAWFNDVAFNVDNWTRGLGYMAEHAADWTALVSMSLRNELRRPDSNPDLVESSYNWRDWYDYIQQGAAAVNNANPDPLVILSGLDFDTWLTPVVQGTALTPSDTIFDREGAFPGFGSDKLVLELHNYANDASDCQALQDDMYEKGYQALHSEDSATVNVFPVLLTEFGFDQTGTEWQGVYFNCLADLLGQERSGWFQWTISGSYYTRSGTQDLDETWGLLNHDWSDWRNQQFIDQGLVPLIESTVMG